MTLAISNNTHPKSNAPLEPPQTSVELKEKNIPISDDEAARILRAQGLVLVGPKGISDLAKLGIYLDSIGTTKVQNGRSLVNQEQLAQATKALSDLISREMGKKRPPAKMIIALAHALGFVGGKLTEAQKFLAEYSNSSDGGGKPPPRVPSFPPGVNIQINTNKNGEAEVKVADKPAT